MPPVELTVLLGQIQRALDIQAGGVWQITADPGAGAALRFAARAPQVSVACEIFGDPAGDAELRLSFDEGPIPSLETETTVGESMVRVHQALVTLLGPPPAAKMWLMTDGQWLYGTRFSA